MRVTERAAKARLNLPPRPAAHRRTRGQAIVEFAIVLPLMMLILLVAIDFGRLYFTYVGVNNAAREGAAYAQVHPDCPLPTSGAACGDPRNVRYQARQEMGDDSLELVSVTCSVSGCPNSIDVPGPSGDHVTVKVRYGFRFVTPLISDLFGGQIWLGASSSAVIP